MGRASQKKKKRQVWLRSAQVKTRACPVCQVQLDGATKFSVDQPAEPFDDMPDDSVTVCVYCGTVLVVERGAFRLITGEEFAGLDPLEQLLLTTIPNPQIKSTS